MNPLSTHILQIVYNRITIVIYIYVYIHVYIAIIWHKTNCMLEKIVVHISIILDIQIRQFKLNTRASI